LAETALTDANQRLGGRSPPRIFIVHQVTARCPDS